MSRKFSPKLLIIALLITCLTPLHAQETPSQDEILLDNGSRIFGTVTAIRDGIVTVDTDFAGTLNIKLDKVISLQSSNPTMILLADETVVREQSLQISEKQLLLTDENGVQETRSLDELKVLNPEPWELGEGYKWSGLINFAFAVERGNSDTDELDYRLDTNWRSTRDRYTLKLDGEIDEANNVKNTDNWTANGKYDRFLKGPNYWGVQLFAEEDEFADLDLRYFLGPYYGREFSTDPVLSFSAEAGITYVNENFITADDQDYAGATWTFHLASNYLGGDSTLYFDQLGIWNLDVTSDYIVNSTFGLSFPLLFGLETAAEIQLDYDAGAVEGVDELDETYALRIGYRW